MDTWAPVSLSIEDCGAEAFSYVQLSLGVVHACKGANLLDVPVANL